MAPLPSTKETGILLLADGIEAASRAMKNPTYPRLENLVNRMVDERVKEGQLGHCPLTFRDLQLIKEAFMNAGQGYLPPPGGISRRQKLGRLLSLTPSRMLILRSMSIPSSGDNLDDNVENLNTEPTKQ